MVLSIICGCKNQSCQLPCQSWREVRVISLITTIDCTQWRGYFVNQDVIRFCFLRGWIRSCLLSFALQISILINIFCSNENVTEPKRTKELNDYSLPYDWTCCVYACNNTIICQNERLIILINDQRQPKYAHHCQHTSNRVNAAKL